LTDAVVSVVIGSTNAASLEACLAALEQQLDGRVEVIVCESDFTAPGVRERYGWATFVEHPDALVPELWREGIDRSRGDVVALTIAPMAPASDWIATIRREYDSHPVVGGAIEPGERLRLADWAEYFCRYARDMLPFETHPSVDLPGDNAAYDRNMLVRVSGLFRDGFWEPVVHRQLARDGVELWHSPRLVVRQGRSSGVVAFIRQRLEHGRIYGHQRGDRFGTWRNTVGVLGSPLVPPLMTLRVVREVARRGRLRSRLVLALPLIVLFNAAWAVGEARGHADVLMGLKRAA
jgi:hypothetical protein